MMMRIVVCRALPLLTPNGWKTAAAAAAAIAGSISVVLHQDHYLYTKASRWAFEEHLRQKNFEVARNYGLLCLNAYRKYKVRNTLNLFKFSLSSIASLLRSI